MEVSVEFGETVAVGGDLFFGFDFGAACHIGALVGLITPGGFLHAILFEFAQFTREAVAFEFGVLFGVFLFSEGFGEEVALITEASDFGGELRKT